MPNYKGHLLGGAVVYVAGVYAFPFLVSSPMSAVCGFIACLAGSLFPDIDIKSRGQKLFYILMFVCLAFFVYKNRIDFFVVTSFLALVPLFVKHRGLFHYLWFLLLFSLVLGCMLAQLVVIHQELIMYSTYFFCAGAFSHVLLDRFFSTLTYWWKR